MIVKHLTGSDFNEMVFDFANNPDSWRFLGNRPCVVVFYLPPDHNINKDLNSILKDVAEDYRNSIDIYIVNAKKEEQLISNLGIKNFPTLLFCPMKDIPRMIHGIPAKEQFIQLIHMLLLSE